MKIVATFLSVIVFSIVILSVAYAGGGYPHDNRYNDHYRYDRPDHRYDHRYNHRYNDNHRHSYRHHDNHRYYKKPGDYPGHPRHGGAPNPFNY